MKTIHNCISIFILILNLSTVFAQKPELIKIEYSDLRIIDSLYGKIPYEKLLDKEFTKILTGQSTNFGTFATLGTEDDIASLSGHIAIQDHSSLGINLKGGVTEGTVSLLNGQEVNPNVSIGLQLNIGIYKNNKKDTLRADATQVLNFINTIDSLIKKTSNLRYQIDISREKKELEVKQKVLLIKQKERNLKLLMDYKPKTNKTDIFQQEIESDSIMLIFESTTNEITQLKKDTYDLKQDLFLLTTTMLDREKQNIEGLKSEKYKMELQKLSLISYNLDWFSFNCNISNRTFELLDTTLSFDNQINKSNFNTFELGLKYNKYQLKDEPFRTYYYSIGISYLIEDNFDDLVKTTLIQKQDISSASLSRTIEKTKTVYIGDYRYGISKLKLNYNLYWFLTYNQSIALHFNPTVRTDFKEEPKIDCVAGFLVGFRNQEKANTVINTELFYDIKDIFTNSQNEDDKFIDRGTIGIKLSFPIFFNQKL
jgi:hypothetical protein